MRNLRRGIDCDSSRVERSDGCANEWRGVAGGGGVSVGAERTVCCGGVVGGASGVKHFGEEWGAARGVEIFGESSELRGDGSSGAACGDHGQRGVSRFGFRGEWERTRARGGGGGGGGHGI